MDEEIATHMAKLKVFRSQSILSGKTSVTEQSDGMNSYLEKRQGKTHTFNANARSFVPQMSQKEVVNDQLDTGTRPEEKKSSQLTHMKPTSEGCYKPQQHSVYRDALETTQMQPGNMSSAIMSPENGEQNNMLDIMRKQNEITTLLIQQQCLSSLPKREIPNFDGDPLQYHAFVKAHHQSLVYLSLAMMKDIAAVSTV